MMRGIEVTAAGLLAAWLAAGAAWGQATGPENPAEYAAPPGFSRLEFEGRPADARTLNEYLWYHFSRRLGNNRTLFNKEYLTLADMWLGGAIDRHRCRPIQEVHREDLGSIQIDEEGYVHSHQHFSHAHDHGWPFPLWTQAGPDADHVRGTAVGWHFQPDDSRGGWIWLSLKPWNRPEYYGATATEGWTLHHCRSAGIVEHRWRIESTGPGPTITTPEGMSLDAFNAPFLQLRWKRSGQAPAGVLPFVEWLRAEDEDFGPDRRVYIHPTPSDFSAATGTTHAIMAMHRHPLWQGPIRRLRLSLAPGESDVVFDIDSLFTAYDTRHAINNPVFVLACWNYFRWTGDLAFLRENINRMRIATRYQMNVMGGLEHNHILNTWPGHDGLAGWVRNPDGTRTFRPGHGIGNNYYDLLPFGWKDCYATMQYYAVLRAMADIERAVQANPGWGIPLGTISMNPRMLRDHADAVRQIGNELFWNEETGRYVACIDREGGIHDYGYTWLGLEAVWYGFATEEHARAIMDWISGRRIVEGDTSTGEDIYHWRFGPRVSTRRNEEWYGQGWISPEAISWGGQIQDGGAVLGFAFYDLMARLRVYGPDDAWQRLEAILEWERQVRAAGGYRSYYADGRQGTTLQGGGTAGGIGIDFEFYESSLPPAFVIEGLIGLSPRADVVGIAPRLPSGVPAIAARDVMCYGARMDVEVGADRIVIELKDPPRREILLEPEGSWKLEGSQASVERFMLVEPGRFVLVRS